MNFADQFLSEIAISIPMATEVFRKHRLDFCCGGRRTLREACEKQMVDLASITFQLEKIQTTAPNEVLDMSLGKITDFIVRRYHEDLRRRIPELLALAGKVERVHGEHPACPHGILETLQRFHQEMLTHMMKEETVLFPLINSGKGNHAGMPVKVMMLEHDAHGKELGRLHELTEDFSPPDGACATWRALYRGLEELEKELMEHIHLENNILFPRALAESVI